jgi:hypothetical protein
MYLHCEQKVAFSLSQIVHNCTAGALDMAVRDAAPGGATAWYLYQLIGSIVAIG